MGRLGDCEQVVAGFIGQPANTYSSLGYVVVGLIVASRFGRSRAALPISLALLLVGAGSLLFHGQGGVAAEAVHAVSVTALLAAVLLIETTHPDSGPWLFRLVVLAAVAVVPGIWREAEMPIQLLLVGLIVATLVSRRRQTEEQTRTGSTTGLLGPILLLAGAFLVFALSRTDGPWCLPDSAAQGHAVWHVLSAAAVGWYALRRTGNRVRSRP